MKGYLTEFILSWPLGLIVSALFIWVTERIYRTQPRMRWSRRILLLCLGVYLTVLFRLTLTPIYTWSLEHFGENINLIPFQVFARGEINLNLWGNVAAFLPFGLLLVLLSRRCRNILVTAACGCILSAGIEIGQLFSIRATDIDDILLNTFGTIVGFLIGKALLSLFPKLQGLRAVSRRNSGKPSENGGIWALPLCILLAVCVLDPSGQESVSIGNPYQDHLATIAENVYLFRQDQPSHPLYEKNSTEKIAPASTAKLLTALTALDFSSLDEVVTVGDEVNRISADSSKAWLQPGNQLTMEQLLAALLLPSGNDAAHTLAVHIGRKIGQSADVSEALAIHLFMKEMNQKAVQIGAAHSYFTTPDGYDDAAQYTTAYDLAQIAKACLETDILKQIMSCYEISQTWTSGQQVTYHSTNELLNPSSPYYNPSIIGLKTGSSAAAGACLISAVKIKKEIYICVVMNSTEEGRWTDTLRLYRLLKEDPSGM